MYVCICIYTYIHRCVYVYTRPLPLFIQFRVMQSLCHPSLSVVPMSTPCLLRLTVSNDSLSLTTKCLLLLTCFSNYCHTRFFVRLSPSSSL